MAASDKRDTERLEILGELLGEVMVFQPMSIKEISNGGAQVETGFPLSSIPSRLPAHAQRPLRHHQGPRRALQHQRRRSGSGDLPVGDRIHRARRARGRGCFGIHRRRPKRPSRAVARQTLISRLPAHRFHVVARARRRDVGGHEAFMTGRIHGGDAEHIVVDLACSAGRCW